MREIILPETKPATEWVNGRALRKVSPRRKHALAQGVFFGALHHWVSQYGLGRVGTEWEFRVQPQGEQRRPLVPDVAYLSYERVPFDAARDADIPRVAPDVVVEVLSPDDRPRDVEEKIRVYFATGTSVIFLVDTEARTITARDPERSQTFNDADDLLHPALPHFSMSIRTLFDEPQPGGARKD